MIGGAHALRFVSMAACAFLVGCSANSLTTSTTPHLALRLAYADDSSALVRLLSQRYAAQYSTIQFTLESSTHAALMARLRANQIDYFITPHLELQPDLWAAPLAQDALVLVVHPNNPLDSLTLDEARRLVQGYIPQWASLGGASEAVRLLSLEDSSAAHLAIEARLLGQRRISPSAQLVPSLDTLRQIIRQDEAAAAYLLYSQLSPGLKPLALDGVLPNQGSIRNGSYPLALTVYIVGRTEPDGELRQFLGWVQSATGQSALSACCAPLP